MKRPREMSGDADTEEDTATTAMTGKIIRSLHSIDPSHRDHQGLIAVIEEGGAKKVPGRNYSFGILGVSNQADCLQKGELVKFQICTAPQTRETMAGNVVSQCRAVVESVKSQFGFIAYEMGESKKLFFRTSDVQDGLDLRTGDEVEFSVICNQRSGKYSACNVRRVSEAPPRPDHLVNRLKSIARDDASAPRVVIVRQPRGPNPDGSKAQTLS